MRVCLIIVCLTLLVNSSGCGDGDRMGPEMVRVSGTVTLDGEAVEGAHVTFSPDASGPVAFAVSDEQGRYELQSSTGKGAVPGLYGVFVVREVSEGGMEFDSQADMEAYVEKHGERPPAQTRVNTLPGKYSTKKTSGLTAEINLAQKNRVDLPLLSE